MVTRRQILKRAAATAPALALGGGTLAREAGAAGAKSPAAGKNLVIFITDQDRAIQHFPEGWAEENLPGLTRLQQNGVTFDNAFCNSCMCSPSRASMFTGYFPAQHGVKYTLEEDMPAPKYPQVELPTNLKNVASVMSSAGYDVVYKGKWHLSKPDGDEFAPADLQKYGFARWNPPDAGADQSIPQEGGGLYDNDGRYMDSTGSVEAGEEGVLQYLSTAAASGSKPFCLIISLVNPHDVLLYPKNYVEGGYDDSWLEGNIDLPETVDENLSSKPDAQANFRRIFNLTGKLDTRQKKLDYLNFYGNLMKEVDGYLVEVMDTLDSVGLTDDTIVIRTSDHGEMGLAHGGLRQKNFNAYEETLRVPMVYSNPEIIRGGTTCNAMVSHVDLLPTLAGLVDAPRSARAKWQGKDYSKLVLGKSKKPVQDYVAFTFDDYQAGQKQGPYVKAPQHIVAIREKNWKIAKYYDANREVPPQWELYDLRNDPLESRNLAAPKAKRNARQQAHFRRLRKKLLRVEKRRLQPLPQHRFSVRSCTLKGLGVTTRMRVPGRGRVIQRVSATVDGKRVELGRRNRLVLGRSRASLKLRLKPKARRLARRGPLELRVLTTYLPNGGTPVREVRKVKLRRR
jgi:choline-sulfatase